MIISISKSKINSNIITFSIALFLFSSTCFWEENSLDLLLLSGIIVIVLTLVSCLYSKLGLATIVHCGAIRWIIVNFILFEVYGLLFLKAGKFNWDFIGFNGILLTCIAIMCLTINSSEELIDCISTSCKLSIFATAIYMFSTGAITFRNISMGTRLGDSLSGNVNTVATCFGMMYLPVFYSVVLKKKRSIFGIVCCGIAAICMVITGSKKAMLVILISVFMILFLYRKPYKYILFPLLIVIGVHMVLNVQILYNALGFRIIDMLASFGIGNAVTAAQSTTIRKYLISIGLKSSLGRPILGGGMNYFQYINKVRYYSHNNFVEILNNAGVVGLFMFYGIAIRSTIFFLMHRKYVNNKLDSIYILCLAMIGMKLLLDMAMVSFSSLGVYYLPFLFPAIIMYKEKRSLRLKTEH